MMPAWVERVSRWREEMAAAGCSPLFESGEIHVARAPGRLDVMGGIADYSGSLVLQYPLARDCVVVVQRNASGRVRLGSRRGPGVWSTWAGPIERALDDPSGCGREPGDAWVRYLLGCLHVLDREARLPRSGLDLMVVSEVPEGKGVSSSAALEVATMSAVEAAFARTLEPRERALLCQRVENEVVGAACGVMDQMVSCLGRRDELLALVCQPATLQPAVKIPAELRIFGLDSGVRHAVSGASYAAVRIGAFMGYRIVAEREGLNVRLVEAGRVEVEDPVHRGYLAGFDAQEFDRKHLRTLPLTLRGEEFLHRYQGITDRVTRVAPDRTYAVRVPTAHPVHENARTRRFAELLSAPLTERSRSQLGELMGASHASYSACGLGTPQTDRLVELVRASDPAAGLIGAKISGGGLGGTVVVLARAGADAALDVVARQFEREFSHRPEVFRGSADGAAFRAPIRLAWQPPA